MFAQTFLNHTPTGPFIILSVIESTNNYAMAKLHAGMVVPGTCFMALGQTAGKGQRGRVWNAKPGQNITMSVVLQPEITKPFIFSAAMALACYDLIKEVVIDEIFIKWPNDVYIGDRKAAGILIENTLKGGVRGRVIVGVGVNVNQDEFAGLETKAASIKMITGIKHDVVRLGKALHRHICSRHEWLKTVPAEKVMEEYNSKLYKKNEETKLRKGNIVFNTVINRVSEDGELVTVDAMERRFNVGEVEFI